MRTTGYLDPTQWTAEQFNDDLQQAIRQFRAERLEEPLERYAGHFIAVQSVLEDLIQETADLTRLGDHALDILSKPEFLDGIRFLTGPPISLDDLKILVDANSLTPQTLKAHPEIVQRLLGVIRDGLDRRRFPWMSDGREATQPERDAAILSSAAIMATRKTETERRSTGKNAQERDVHTALREIGFVEVKASRTIGTIADAPGPGTFCKETVLGSRKADVVVGLWDRRVMAIECKVSNSSTNSVKRLNNDAAQKAVRWLTEFGQRQIVPVAVLNGVYKLRNLEQAQENGLIIYWAHRLSDLTDWISRTRAS